MEQISPSDLSNTSNEKSKPIEFWIKFWGIGLALQGLSMFLIKTKIENIILTTGFGLALAFGKRNYVIHRIALFFSAFLVIAAIVWTIYSIEIKPDQFRSIYFLVSTLFFIGLFTFLLMPDVKKAFGPLPLPKPLLALTYEEERKIKFWVRVVAIVLIAESLISNLFSNWFRSHGFPDEGNIGAAIGVIAGLGLLFFRPNIGRKLGLFV